MKAPSIPVIATRAVEIVFSIIIISVFYGTDTVFKIQDDGGDPGDKFGQFVIIGGLISAVIILVLTIVLELDKKLPYVIIGYNLVWIIFYFSSSVMILSYWSGDSWKNNTYLLPNATEDELMTAQNGGFAVGSFELFEDVVLVLNSLFTIIGNTNLH